LKKIHLLVVKSYIGPLIATFFISLFLLLMQFLWKYIDDLVGKGLDFLVIAELLMYASASLVPMALPLAILLSSLMTFGNMGEHNELIALKSAGISLQRIMFPLIVLSIIISTGAFFFSNNVMPYTNLKFGALLFDVRHQRPELDIKAGVFYNGLEGYSIKIAHKDKKTNMLHNLMIYDHSERNGNLYVTVADSGTMKVTNDRRYLVFTLFDGASYAEMKEARNKNETYPHRRDEFKEQRIIFELTGYGLERSDENLFKHNYQMLNLKQLAHADDSLALKLEGKKTTFKNNLLRTNYFKKENKKRVYNKDTAQTFAFSDTNVRVSNMDSVFNKMASKSKIKIIDNAMNFARTTQSYINSTTANLKGKEKWLNRHRIEWHRKFTLSFACLILFFIGAPLGAIIRKGGLGMPVVTSVLFFIIYYIISISGEKYVKTGVLPAAQGMWISSIILFPLGIFLTYKATTDSVILNIDTYFNFIKKLNPLKLLKRFEEKAKE
jgi:lipopolysaccharide export system permease protein